MTRLLCDTHAVLWWLADDERRYGPAREAMAAPENIPLVSAAGVWEMAIKRALGKLDVPDELPAILVEEGFDVLPVTATHAWATNGLPPRHRDPFDRLLDRGGRPIATADPQIAGYAVTTV